MPQGRGVGGGGGGGGGGGKGGGGGGANEGDVHTNKIPTFKTKIQVNPVLVMSSTLVTCTQSHPVHSTVHSQCVWLVSPDSIIGGQVPVEI